MYGVSFMGGKDWYYVITRPDPVDIADRERYFAPRRIEDVLDLTREWD